jgi:hypothetical protein
LKIILMVL